MNGAGNDFVMLDNRSGQIALSRELIARLCDRHRGVGADGILVTEKAQGDADFRMRYYNADGGEAEMCGNGARCFARFSRRFLPDAPDRIAFETLAGTIEAQFEGEDVTVRMSDPHSWRGPLPLTLEGRAREVHFVNTGVPHAVTFVEDLEGVDLPLEGAAIRWHETFAPQGTNANFVAIEAPGCLAIRTYERGVEGETLACGTGICAAALIHARVSGASSPVRIHARGGDDLQVAFDRAGENFSNVRLTGPAEFVFQGSIAID